MIYLAHESVRHYEYQIHNIVYITSTLVLNFFKVIAGSLKLQGSV